MTLKRKFQGVKRKPNTITISRHKFPHHTSCPHLKVWSFSSRMEGRWPTLLESSARCPDSTRLQGRRPTHGQPHRPVPLHFHSPPAPHQGCFGNSTPTQWWRFQLHNHLQDIRWRIIISIIKRVFFWGKKSLKYVKIHWIFHDGGKSFINALKSNPNCNKLYKQKKSIYNLKFSSAFKKKISRIHHNTREKRSNYFWRG